MAKRQPQPGAVFQVFDPEGGMTEQHSFVCCHCGNGTIVPIEKKVEEVSDICRNCWRLHCLRPECCDRCTPFMKKVEAAEARDYNYRRSMGLS